MTTKARIAKLEKQKPAEISRRELVRIDDVSYERSMNALADALNIPRAEVDRQLKELRNDKPSVKP